MPTPSGADDAGSETSRSELRDRIANLQSRLTRLNETVDARDERIATLQRDLSQLRARLDARNETVASLESMLAERETRIDELETQIDQSTPEPNDTSEFSDEVVRRAREMAHEARHSVVSVNLPNGHGTGWVLDADAGHIVTNAHVVRDTASPEIETFEGETVTGERLGYDEDLAPDVALVQADVDVPALSTGDRSTLDAGTPLVTIGHPAVAGDWVITMGRYDRYEPGIDWLLSTVPTDNGNSGGPLLTLDGSVVALISGTTTMEADVDRTKSDEVYTSMPEPPKLATSNPIETVLDRVDDWD